MPDDFHNGRERIAASTWRAALALCLAAALACAAAPATHAQNLPTQPIGRIEGADVTVESGMPASMATADTPASIYVSNGSVVTVHSGKARLTLDGGGELDICGPAKFTMLASGKDLTVALNFGRIHAQIPASTSLKIFSPTIIATPIDINGGSRDVTIGLDMNDTMCVLATSGAIQIEHQFTGERLIVPQAGEFFLNGGTLAPVASKPGSCDCTPMPKHTPPTAPATIPEFARAARSPAVAIARPQEPQASWAGPQAPAEQGKTTPGAVFVIPVNPNDEHPVAKPEIEDAGEAPNIDEAVQADITPALAFMAAAPPAPNEEEPEMMLLVREAREAPDWEFDGEVLAPDFAEAMRHALGEEREAPKTAGSNTAARPRKKKHGFWAALKRLFVGEVEAAGPAN